MLSYGYFKEQIKVVAAAFGLAESRVEKMEPVYYRALDPRISDSQFTRTIEYVLTNSDRFPTIKALLEIARTYPDPTVARESEVCALCEGSGTLSAVRKYSGHSYTTLFKCSCSNCVHDYPAWQDDFSKVGYTPTFKNRSEWNPHDKHQVKGLALMGVKSRAWKCAPQDCREAADRLVGVVVPGSVSEALTSKSDPEKEKERRARINHVEQPVFDILGRVHARQ